MTLNNKLLLILWIACLYFFSSCENTGIGYDIEQERGYVETLIDQVDSIIIREGDSVALKFVDSLAKDDPYKNTLVFRKSTLQVLSKIYYNLKDYTRAIATINQALLLVDSHQNYFLRDRPYVLIMKADIYLRMGNYQQAYTQLYQARKISEQINDTCSYANYDYRIAVVLYRQEQYREAKELFKKSFWKYEICSKDFANRYRLQEILTNIGLCYYQLGNYDSAIFYYDSALVQNFLLKDESPHQIKYDRVAAGVINGNIGKAYAALKDFPKAIEHLKYNIDINIRPDYDQQDALTSLLALAEIYVEEQKWAEVRVCLDKIDEVNALYSRSDITEKALNLEWQYHLEKNDLREGLEVANRYKYVSDSIQKSRNVTILSDVRLSIQSLESDYEIELLKNENATKNTVVIYSVALVVLVLLIAFIILYAWLNARKQNRMLETLNIQIASQNILLAQSKKDLESINVKLEHEAQEKDRILSIVAHDLRNPISAISSICTILAEDNTTEETKYELIGLIQSSCLSSLELINEILVVSEINKGENEFLREELSLHQLIQSTVDLIRFKAEEKNQKIVLQLPEEDRKVQLNIEKIRRAISNLINNAIKFSHEETEIQVIVTYTDHTYRIHVRDFGIGIPDKILPDIFKSFSGAKRFGTNGETPFGLGLSIVKQIVEVHGGKIHVESQPNKGATFTIELPF